jgi:hypothetical protein
MFRAMMVSIFRISQYPHQPNMAAVDLLDLFGEPLPRARPRTLDSWIYQSERELALDILCCDNLVRCHARSHSCFRS